MILEGIFIGSVIWAIVATLALALVYTRGKKLQADLAARDALIEELRDPPDATPDTEAWRHRTL